MITRGRIILLYHSLYIGPDQMEELPFQARLDLESRREIGDRARMKHPTHIPAIIERGGKDAPHIDKERFLLPLDLTGAQLQYVVRRRLKMDKEKAIFLFCGNNYLISSAATAKDLYARHKDPQDRLLYIKYSLENTFGGSPF